MLRTLTRLWRAWHAPCVDFEGDDRPLLPLLLRAIRDANRANLATRWLQDEFWRTSGYN